jgi:pimeloyl-ACP methyl ester carboxylesterase
MFKHALTTLALVAGLAGGLGAAHAQAPAAAAAAPAPAAAPNDYANPAAWLCRPGRTDACTVNLDATVIAADGTMTIDRFHADPNAPIDCFYVYPTVSRDPGANSTMAIEPEETNVVVQQFARFGAKCRLYAPMYRQFTLTALTAMMTGHPTAGVDRTLGYNDVVDAWNEYLAHDNHGRGVVLIGHSQGSGVLTQLIAKEIDGKPVQKQILSAILMGTSLQVPPGKDVGGSFKTVPLCHSPTQLGCAIAFADFRADSPPPANSRFGKGRPAEGTVAACVNPAALGGGSGELKAFMPARAAAMASAPASWTDPPSTIDTPFVELPGLLSGECVADEHGTYLAITVHPTPGGKRVNDIPGDLVIGGVVQKDWGLHLIDANLHMGKLVEIVGDESGAYLAQGGKSP